MLQRAGSGPSSDAPCARARPPGPHPWSSTSGTPAPCASCFRERPPGSNALDLRTRYRSPATSDQSSGDESGIAHGSSSRSARDRSACSCIASHLEQRGGNTSPTCSSHLTPISVTTSLPARAVGWSRWYSPRGLHPQLASPGGGATVTRSLARPCASRRSRLVPPSRPPPGERRPAEPADRACCRSMDRFSRSASGASGERPGGRAQPRQSDLRE